MSRPETMRETLRIEPHPVAALGALFDLLPTPEPGQALPPLWHWAALARWAPAGGTGPDGHPAVGDFLPDVGKPRRMFAGGTVELHVPVLVGDEVVREQRVLSVTPKTGRQGEFVLVKVETTVSTARGDLAIREVQDLVYRDAAVPSAATEPTPLAPHDVVPALLGKEGDEWVLRTDPTKLMRFSAATSNGHRIHYDLAHVTGAEGYPGLVVHGPLITLALLEVLRAEGAPRPRTLRHRGVRPLFCGSQAWVQVAQGEGSTQLTLVSDAGEHAVLEVAW